VVSDVVTVTNVTYSAGSQILTVEATSSAQPGVALMAEGYGNLPWREAESQYRRRFQNVTTRPDSIVVTSSGGGSAAYTLPQSDSVVIQTLIYNASTQTLLVEATSSSQPGVSLVADGFGSIPWRINRSIYRRVFQGVTSAPTSVTVISSGGGTATGLIVPDTLEIVALTYDAGTQILLVEATSSDQPTVTLRAEGFGNLPWRETRSSYRRKFQNVATQPASVFVTSSGSGSISQTLP